MLNKTIKHPISYLLAIPTIIFVCAFIWLCTRISGNVMERQRRTEVTATIENASNVREERKVEHRTHNRTFKRYEYFQDFTVRYTNKGKEYTKRYKNFNGWSNEYYSDYPRGYIDGDKIEVFINPSNVKDVKIDKELIVETLGIKQVGIVVGVLIFIILIPKPEIKTEKSKNKDDKKEL